MTDYVPEGLEREELLDAEIVDQGGCMCLKQKWLASCPGIPMKFTFWTTIPLDDGYKAEILPCPPDLRKNIRKLFSASNEEDG